MVTRERSHKQKSYVVTTATSSGIKVETVSNQGANEIPVLIAAEQTSGLRTAHRELNGLSLRIVPDSTMQVLVINGRDIWKILKLTVNRDKNTVKKREVEEVSEDSSKANSCEILNINASTLASDKIDALDISEKIMPEQLERFKELFKDKYLMAERPVIPGVRIEIELQLKEHSPFHFSFYTMQDILSRTYGIRKNNWKLEIQRNYQAE